MMQRIHPLLLGLAILWLAACARPGATPDDSYQITLLPDPDGYPGAVMRVEVLDEAGTPVTDATVSLEGNMSHAGMVPVLTASVLDEADGAADGIYTVPFSLTMLGDWIITVKLTPRDGDPVARNIDLRVTEDAVTADP